MVWHHVHRQCNATFSLSLTLHGKSLFTLGLWQGGSNAGQIYHNICMKWKIKFSLVTPLLCHPPWNTQPRRGTVTVMVSTDTLSGNTHRANKQFSGDHLSLLSLTQWKPVEMPTRVLPYSYQTLTTRWPAAPSQGRRSHTTTSCRQMWARSCRICASFCGCVPRLWRFLERVKVLILIREMTGHMRSHSVRHTVTSDCTPENSTVPEKS